MVSVPAASASVPPLTIEVKAALLEVAVIGVEDDSVKIPVGETVGAASPPLLLKFRLFSVLLPTKVSVARPFKFTLEALAICWLFTNIATVVPVPCTPPLMVRSPGITTAPAVVALRFKVP